MSFSLLTLPCVLMNLQVKDRTWLILRDEGMVVEEALDEDGDDQDGTEKGVLDEKTVLQMDSDSQSTAAVDILPSEPPGNGLPGGKLSTAAEYEANLESSDLR